jgi:glycogen operon protein
MPKLDLSKLSVSPGRPYPTGQSVYDGGVRFTIFSRHATAVWLALFEQPTDSTPVWEVAFEPEYHRTGDMWSIFVHGLSEGAYYMYRMDGPFDPEEGHRYDASVYLLDPYSKAFVGDIHDGTMKCVTVHEQMDWRDNQRPRIAMKDMIIYETHVRGFTRHSSSDSKNPGTYQGIIDKIPYLVDLGVNALELLPIQEFGETLLGRCSVDGRAELTNYWGYSSIGFFAPAGRYACSAQSTEHLEEFRRMVHALHGAGIEVILDVVFNHTSEGNERGPTLSFRGIDNSIYYLLEGDQYYNFSGCGNTVNCDHPLVRDFILDCLRYWVAVMHVDGFRFDLASILGRNQEGRVQDDAPLVRRIAEDPVLRDVKLIAEAWDAGGAYQVGSFGGIRWAEWNGRYRDDVRKYWRGDPGTRGDFAVRLTGSADLYQWADRTPEHSINFITCHDGFTLRDLVSYEHKHNEANGENNQDGGNDNISINCGVEGETEDAAVNRVRLRMQKNYLATLFLSLGVPMMLSGDEFGRTQRGNNNAYCQDNDLSWLNWNLVEANQELHRFCREMIAFRKKHAVFMTTSFFEGQKESSSPKEADLLWFDERGHEVDWQSSDTVLACRIRDEGMADLYLMFNNAKMPKAFQLPCGEWSIRIDTARRSPNDIVAEGEIAAVARDTMVLDAQSVAVLAYSED